jgi:hypothetical protein
LVKNVFRERRNPAHSPSDFEPRNRDLRLYSHPFWHDLGHQVQSVAIGWQVYDITRDPVALAMSGWPFSCPCSARATGRRYVRSRRSASDADGELFRASVASAMLLVLTLTGVTEMWAFYSVITLLGIALGLSQPAMQSFLPFLVTLDKLPQAIAWNASAYRIAVIAGPAVGGFLYDLGPAVNYGVCLALYIFTVVGMPFCTCGPKWARAAKAELLNALWTASPICASGPILLGAISLDLFAMFLGGTTALLPIFARGHLADRSDRDWVSADRAGDRGRFGRLCADALAASPPHGNRDVHLRGLCSAVANDRLWLCPRFLSLDAGARRCGAADHGQRLCPLPR